MYSYDNSIKGVYKPSFTSEIIPTKGFVAGINRSKELIKEGSEEGLAKVNRFINNLEFIKSDKSSDYIELEPEVSIISEGKKQTFKFSEYPFKNLGEAFMEMVDGFVRERYGASAAEELAEKQIPQLAQMSMLSMKYEAAKASAQRGLSGMIKSIDVHSSAVLDYLKKLNILSDKI